MMWVSPSVCPPCSRARGFVGREKRRVCAGWEQQHQAGDRQCQALRLGWERSSRDTSGCHLPLCMYPRAVPKLSRDGDAHPSLQAASAPAAASPQPPPARVTPSWAPAHDTNPTTHSQDPSRQGNDAWRASQQAERCGQGDPSGAGSDGLWMRSRAQNINIGADNNSDAWEGEDGSPAISGHYCSSCNASPRKNGMDTSRQCVYLKSPKLFIE